MGVDCWLLNSEETLYGVLSHRFVCDVGCLLACLQTSVLVLEQQLARGVGALAAGGCPPPVAAAASQLLQAAQQSEDIQKRYAALPPTEQASQMGMVQQNMSLVAQQHTLAKTIATWAKTATVTPSLLACLSNKERGGRGRRRNTPPACPPQ